MVGAMSSSNSVRFLKILIKRLEKKAFEIFPEKETRQKEGTFFTEKCSVAFYFQYTLFKIGIICEF
jgi:hypothetical protein